MPGNNFETINALALPQPIKLEPLGEGLDNGRK
jgi:hypothetical protein